MIKGTYVQGEVFSNDVLADTLCNTKCFGERAGEKVVYFPEEALFLVESGKLQVFDLKGKEIFFENLLKKFSRKDGRFFLKYAIFSDLRKKGYVVKPALKFGADFRVYEKGRGVFKNHSFWLLEVLGEQARILIKDVVSKSRVAHSTKKKLMIAVLDGEGEASYFEVCWRKMR
ncbi:tRNA-intron lyase [Candidatus Pacearchaeota archaeon]|nr:MAG: tRNA-intron lyase [Candidatus Pacearchaeota archaeon]